MHRIETIIKNGYVDSIADNTLKSVRNHLNHSGINLDKVRTVRGYTIYFPLSREQLELLGKELFSDPIVEQYSIDNPFACSDSFKEFNWFIEIRFKPGVTDNIGNTASTIARDILQKQIVVSSSLQYLLKGSLNKEMAEKIGRELLGNELIEDFVISKIDKQDNSGKILNSLLPRELNFKDDSKIEYVALDISDEALINLSKARCLALTLEEMKAIRSHFSDSDIMMQRKKIGLIGITDAELELLAQTWSEHCKHKIFNADIDYKEVQFDNKGNSQILKSAPGDQ